MIDSAALSDRVAPPSGCQGAAARGVSSQKSFDNLVGAL